MARTMLETRRRATTDSSSEATALSADNLDDSRVQLIVHMLQLLLLEEDSSKVGMAAFALEYSYRVDLLEPLATLIDRFPSDGYVLLQSVVTGIPADRDGRGAAGIREGRLQCAAPSVLSQRFDVVWKGSIDTPGGIADGRPPESGARREF